MTKLQKRRAEQWLPGITNGGETGDRGHELFCISTVSVSWL